MDMPKGRAREKPLLSLRGLTRREKDGKEAPRAMFTREKKELKAFS